MLWTRVGLFVGSLLLGLLAIQWTHIESLKAELETERSIKAVCFADKDQLKRRVNEQNTEILELKVKAADAATEAERRATLVRSRKWTPPAQHGNEEMEQWLNSYR